MARLLRLLLLAELGLLVVGLLHWSFIHHLSGTNAFWHN
jgi:hypothetical protein